MTSIAPPLFDAPLSSPPASLLGLASASSTASARPLPVVNLQLGSRTAIIDNWPVAFQPREVRLLQLFAASGLNWVSMEALCSNLVGEVSDLKRHLLCQYIYSLRRKLGPLGGAIEHVRSEGYRCLLDIRFV